MRPLLLILLLLSVLGPVRASEAGAASTISVVLLSEPKLPDAKQFRLNLEKRLAGRLTIGEVERDDGEGIMLRAGDNTVVVGLRKAPVPEELIKDLCVNAWYWRQACEETAKHRAQAIVGVMQSSLDRLDTRLLLTDAVAAVLISTQN
jgi:hypothetical protein